MPAWVVLSWNPEDPAATAEAAEHAAKLDRDPRWTRRWRGARAATWSEVGGRVTIRALPGDCGVLVGDLHPLPGAAGSLEVLLAGLPDDPIEAARRLTRSAWGAYGVVFCGAAGQVGVYRDPCGGREVLTWTLGRVAVAAGDLYLLPTALWPRRLALDWDALALQMVEPGLAATATALAGLDSVLPGTLWDPRAGRILANIWTPADHADRFEGDFYSGCDALREVVRHATQALATDHPRLIGELSGGVDSAIVAAAAGPARDRVAEWLHFYAASRPAGDERRFADAVAAELGVALSVYEMRAAPVCEADFADLLMGPRPPLAALGREHDRTVAARAGALGASGVLSGQGGDAVFFRAATPLVLADEARRRGWAAWRPSRLGEVARWTGRPVSAVLAQAWATGRRGRGPAGSARRALPGDSAGSRGGPPHPWLASAERLGPAKRLHIAALANSLVYRGDSRRRRAVDELFPLLSQPVVELCLAMPVEILTAGGRSRALARVAFTGEVPAMVLERSAKGDLSAYYGRCLVDSLDWVRPHLLDGCLVEAGLIDRAALDQALTPQQLVWRGGASAVLSAALTESWVRAWQRLVPDVGRRPRAVD